MPLNNVSVPVGRDATFSCMVKDLGGYRSSPGRKDALQDPPPSTHNTLYGRQVGWVKADTKAIQAIHKHVITHNSRVSVTHSDHNTWMLHIRGVQEEDRGPYMCQINTDPMRSQIGYLEVTVPPEIDDTKSSTDVMVPEGSNAPITCRAHGYPRPKIIWTREDQKPIVLRINDPAMPKVKSEYPRSTKVRSEYPRSTKVRKLSYEGETLNLTQITRSDMGPYLCIANNTVPPIVSKRIMVEVHFRPVIHVPNQLIGVPIGSSAKLECNLEASPKSIQYWTRDTGEMLITNNEFNVQESLTNFYMTKMTLTINQFRRRHAGIYHCTAKNSLGETEGKIKVYVIEVPTEEPAQTDEDITQLGQGGGIYQQVDFSNEIPYGPRSREDTNPTRHEDIYNRGHHVTNPRPNHRTPSQAPVDKNRKHHRPIGGEDQGGMRPTRPPWFGWEKPSSPSSSGDEFKSVNFTLVLVVCLAGLILAYHSNN
ncbi:lachesin-like isoform X1 [Homarus americanus]|uniref:lachesin-like isoform X1 n=1 Tax=Homarus americanus TaxID=6706 RepID=UPI001C492414|nr:lachesin-like isoform X1 [Homarus americanus]